MPNKRCRKNKIENTAHLKLAQVIIKEALRLKMGRLDLISALGVSITNQIEHHAELLAVCLTLHRVCTEKLSLPHNKNCSKEKPCAR